MLTRLLLAALLAAIPMVAGAAELKVPDTPAGRTFAAWLEAFNSEDPKSLETFVRARTAGGDVSGSAKWRDETGGYDLLETWSHDRWNVFFRVRARGNGTEEVGRLEVSEEGPMVEELGTWRIPPGAKIDPVPLDETTRSRLVARIAGEFESNYVFADIGRKMAADLRGRDSRGDYRDIRFGEDLARRLAGDLREISHDRHVDARFSYAAQPLSSASDRADEARRAAAVNCGFEKLEHLPPNIGYLKLNGFEDPKFCTGTAVAALDFVADSDALIIDLRDNGGGDGEMANLLLSHFFAERTHVLDEYTRAGDKTTEVWTSSLVPGRRFVGKPLFILTAKRTFSAAEAMTFALRNQHRAIVVGETTLGGAHRTDARRIDDHFTVHVPYGRTSDPLTKADYEGVGITPDVNVPAAEALRTARSLAEEAIRRRPPPAAAKAAVAEDDSDLHIEFSMPWQMLDHTRELAQLRRQQPDWWKPRRAERDAETRVDLGALARGLRQTIWDYNSASSQLCADGLYTPLSCLPPLDPYWLRESPDETPTIEELRRRQAPVEERVQALWDAACADFRARNPGKVGEDYMRYCSVE